MTLLRPTFYLNLSVLCFLQMQIIHFLPTKSEQILDAESSIARKVWTSIEPHVTADLSYLKSLAKTEECQQAIEDMYIQHVSYSVVRTEDSYSFDLQNLCPSTSRSIELSVNSTTSVIPTHHHNDSNDQSNKSNHSHHSNLSNQSSPESLRIVYLIIMHQHPLQSIRLMEALNTSNDLFLVHIDLKSSDSIASVVTTFADLHSNVHLVCYYVN